MKTTNESVIQRHIQEGGDYIEHDDGYVTLIKGLKTKDMCTCGLRYPSKYHVCSDQREE